jgi:hypothetical protein
LDLFLLLAELERLVAQVRGALEVLARDRLFLLLVEARDLVSMSRRSGGAVIDLMRMRAPASSITSIALSGRKRLLM